MKFLKFPIEETLSSAHDLASMVRRSGFDLDTVVAISRGGLIMGRIMSDLLDVRDLRVIKMEHYTGVEERGETKIEIPIQGRLDGKKVLIVDDVADRGDTLLVASQHLVDMGASDVKIATLHYKPWSKAVPDFYLTKTGSWIVYWWEYAETASSLFSKLTKSGVSKEEALRIIENEAGVPKEVIGWLRLE